MKMIIYAVMFTFCSLSLIPGNVSAHCDTLDGPVIQDAKTALEKGVITQVLKWVKQENEIEIRDVFNKTLKVRGKGKEARELADMYFFETLVRIHRTGEGAPYTGLKPAGEVEPIVAKADEAIKNGSVDDLSGKITGHISSAVKERFERLMDTRKHMNESVEAGREYVEAYVQFVHFVEGLHKIAMGGAVHHEEGGKQEHGENKHKD